MGIAIKVENLSKEYVIKHEKASANYETLGNSLIQGSKNIITRIGNSFKPLKNKSTNPGRVLGIKRH
jgi:hypothetical protein